ncbi:MAG: type I-MYXAN CRISPR-associated Cas8a1/Cmx1 [Deltaproteobacteria bacterium]|nr:type I-MYXAN CRISPR-associated Cas8a1/Cmx1 [Deltaproteobacteria bacterium]
MTQTSTDEMRLELGAPGMTALHRVGLAGLWMTLDAFARGGIGLRGGSWEKDSRSVTLRWTGDPRAFLDDLLRRSFRVDAQGLVWFAALGAPLDHPQHAVALHKSMLGSFLQHGKSRRNRREPGVLSVEVDEQPFAIPFKALADYNHQSAAGDLVSGGRLARDVTLAGWQFPGGAVRHVGFSAHTALTESAGRALLLLFAPVGCIHFCMRQRKEGKNSIRAQSAVVVPEVTDLDVYAEARADFLGAGVLELHCAGAAEAAWRVLSRWHAKGLLRRLGLTGCRVMSFGAVPWVKSQKIRVALATVRPGREQDIETFALCQAALPARLVRPEGKEPFVDVPATPGLVAMNLGAGRPWYAGFAALLGDKRRRAHVFRYEKGGLHQMVTTRGQFDDEARRAFVMACHEAWRRRMGQLGGRARRENISFSTLVSREFERQRVAFSRCKNAATLRKEVTDFWARAGRLQQLAGWADLLPLLGEDGWQEARDLALLALASYQPASEDEKRALDEAVSTAEQGDEEGEAE